VQVGVCSRHFLESGYSEGDESQGNTLEWLNWERTAQSHLHTVENENCCSIIYLSKFTLRNTSCGCKPDGRRKVTGRTLRLLVTGVWNAGFAVLTTTR
jgi:hypothetical protein